MDLKWLSSEKPARIIAVFESVLVTLFWASSFVFVKIALEHFGPLTIAGLRYFIASLVLLPFLLRSQNSTFPRSSKMWWLLFLIGVSAYTIGNGAMFWGLKYLPATTGSFFMSLQPLLMLFAAAVWLREIPTRWQIVGVMVVLIGSGLFFSIGLQPGEPLGLGLVAIGQIGFLAFGVLGRGVARDQQVGTLTLTAVPLALGGGFTLLIALVVEGLPDFSMSGLGIVLLMALLNTALAYTLYNHALQTLTALEMNVILNLTPIGTVVLAWLLLNEKLSLIQLIGMAVVIGGVILVQWGNRKQDSPSTDES